METAADNLSPMRFNGDDAALVAAVRQGSLGASAALYDRYVRHVQRVITRVMGIDPELNDLTNTVFYQALKSIDSLNDPARLKAWITQVAVFTVRNCLRSRKRRRWLQLRPQPEVGALQQAYELDEAALETARTVRHVVSRMSADARVCFALRYFDFMEIQDIADACGVSLRTAKRRLARSEKQFKRIATKYPVLAQRLEESPKWRAR